MPTLTQVALITSIALIAYQLTRKEKPTREDYFITDPTAPKAQGAPLTPFEPAAVAAQSMPPDPSIIEYREQVKTGSLRAPDGTIAGGQYY